MHRQRGASAGDASDDETNNESIGELLAGERLAKNAVDSAADVTASVDTQRKSQNARTHPVHLMRTCVATLADADACGRTLAAEAPGKKTELGRGGWKPLS